MSAFDIISPKDARWRTTADEFRWYRVDRFILHPKRWKMYSTTGPALDWKKVRFDKAGVKAIPDDKMGLYTFFAEPDIAGHSSVRYLLLVGEAKDQSLRKRVTGYLYESNKAKPRIHVSEMLQKFGSHLWLYFAVVDDPTTITAIEDQLLQAFLPPFNRDFPATVASLVKATFS